jgi:hypothetical protein
MQLINLHIRLARADTPLTVRFFLERHLTILPIAKDNTVCDKRTEQEASGEITLTGENLSTPRNTASLCPPLACDRTQTSTVRSRLLYNNINIQANKTSQHSFNNFTNSSE